VRKSIPLEGQPTSVNAPRAAIDRRGFLQMLGGGLLVIATGQSALEAQEAGESGRRSRTSGNQLPNDVAAWLHISPDGKITAFTGKVEVGQNARTSLTQNVADELRCQADALILVMGDTALTPWDAGTFGSRTTPGMVPIVRKMAATARETLLDAAAKKWNADRSKLIIADKFVTNKSTGAKAGFGELAAGLDWVNIVGKESFVTPATNWHAAGTSLTKVNAKDLVTGKHRFPSDQKLAGMLYGRVLRPPSFDAKLISAETKAAAQISGVNVIREGDFIGIAASDEHLAEKALQAIDAKWQEKEQISARDLFPFIKANAEGAESSRATNNAQQGGGKNFSASYTVAYIAHVPLEPRAAVAEWSGGKLTVWTGTQRPFGVRSELAQAFNLPEAQVRVIVPDTGSAYGGKHSGECAIEAARLAKGAGKPVKLIWTREDEFMWAYFRPAGVIDVASSVDKDGRLTAWEFHNYLSGPSGLPTPYEVPNPIVRHHRCDSPLREGSYRGLAATANHFARESHMDELAASLGMDPLEFRLKNLKNERLRAVLQLAADRFQWSRKKADATRGYGIACGVEKNGYVACCAEVAIVPDKQIQVKHVLQAWDSGAVINPLQLKNQLEGSVAMGIGGALFEAIDFSNGRILNGRLSQYPVPRFSHVPKIEIELIDRKDIQAAGAGETGIVCIAPAIANAIYSTTHQRLRSLPMQPLLKA
jgi:CO/xanthine dehydrogenase Mo-binding subunit